ncbi:MAG: hypothetical protein HQK88_12325 [Nitrospirae bacterium]|nr:hypothetical protein [Nitrospirota bacterium]MBF0534552.1 hypothetical protein [Nitrospirota bacterium]MBF0617587.1 hypothetical protein [Nitrospirota bacterium]
MVGNVNNQTPGVTQGGVNQAAQQNKRQVEQNNEKEQTTLKTNAAAVVNISNAAKAANAGPKQTFGMQSMEGNPGVGSLGVGFSTKTTEATATKATEAAGGAAVVNVSQEAKNAQANAATPTKKPEETARKAQASITG